VCVRAYARALISPVETKQLSFCLFQILPFSFSGLRKRICNSRGCEAKITKRGRASVALMVKYTAERLDYPNELGPRMFGKSDCSDKQTCMRILS
jgi:hypothetical protein